jgi:hypothetical protein
MEAENYILRLLQELELIDEVRFDEVEGAFEIERQSVVDLYCAYFKN